MIRCLGWIGLAMWVGCSGGETARPPATPEPAPPPMKEAAPVAQVSDDATSPTATAHPELLTPAELTEQAPETYTAVLTTEHGDIVIDVTRAWAPLGADRFYNLVKHGFFDDAGFFRVVPGFVVQFGLNADPKVNAVWDSARIQDDPVTQSNARGTVVFATAGPNTRTTQIFINYADNARLDGMGFAPFGKVRDMAAVDAIEPKYSQRPDQGMITSRGNAYLRQKFPDLDYITRAAIAP